MLAFVSSQGTQDEENVPAWGASYSYHLMWSLYRRNNSTASGDASGPAGGSSDETASFWLAVLPVFVTAFGIISICGLGIYFSLRRCAHEVRLRAEAALTAEPPKPEIGVQPVVRKERKESIREKNTALDADSTLIMLRLQGM